MMHRSRVIHASDTVFLGDSLTEWFDLDSWFHSKNFVNRGISGDTTGGIIHRIEEIISARPARVFLLAGVNDIFQGVGEMEICNNIEAIIVKFKTASPETRLYIQSLLPVNETVLLAGENINTVIYSINIKLRLICRETGAVYIDLHRDFLNKTGEMDARFTYDGVHLDKDGYRLWAELLQVFLM
ncbi:MAG: hypothetical protein JXA03_09550 [Bacteroidales bacterium]|nr:hypothetical protein [Bacteroidales bacterium]